MANFDVKIKQPKRVEKKWGYELWIHNDNQYCGKLLVFTQSGNKFSMHYHMLKNETWYVQKGAFQFDWIDTEAAERNYTQYARSSQGVSKLTFGKMFQYVFQCFTFIETINIPET